MFRSIYIFFAFTAVMCLLVKIIYHFYKKAYFPILKFPNQRIFYSILFGFLPLKFVQNDHIENKKRRILNYGLFFYYAVVVVLTIADSHLSKTLNERSPRQFVKIVKGD